MKFFCKLVMGEPGDFPGAPDTDTWEISEKDFDYLNEQMKLRAIRQINSA